MRELGGKCGGTVNMGRKTLNHAHKNEEKTRRAKKPKEQKRKEEEEEKDRSKQQDEVARTDRQDIVCFDTQHNLKRGEIHGARKETQKNIK